MINIYEVTPIFYKASWFKKDLADIFKTNEEFEIYSKEVLEQCGIIEDQHYHKSSGGFMSTYYNWDEKYFVQDAFDFFTNKNDFAQNALQTPLR